VNGPLVLGVGGSLALLGGIFLARWLLAVGAVLMIAAAGWNIVARRRCASGACAPS
jgi:hypothetical protein